MAALAMRTSFLLLRVKAGFNPSQPRVPAGNPEGGQWTDGGARHPGGTGTGGNGETSGLTSHVVRDRTGEMPWRAYVEVRRRDGTHISTTVHNRSGSRIISEYLSSGIERNTVMLPGGKRVVFENDRTAQRIYDADRRPISEAVWTPEGPENIPVAQPVFFDSRKPGLKPSLFKTPGQVILDAGIELYNWWLSTQEPDEDVVFSFDAFEMVRGSEEFSVSLHRRTREEVEDACPRFPLIQGMTNKVAKPLNPSQFKNPGAYGTAVHMGVKRLVDALRDPDLLTEFSIYKEDIDASRYGLKGSKRIDILERRSDGTICVYDLKTGQKYILNRKRLLELYRHVRAKFGDKGRVILIEVRPAP